jgi:hypothetical protein
MPNLVALSKLKLNELKYMVPVVSNYNRLEGSPRSKNFGHNLRMEVRDPLWTLCRQWQFGEFAGEDAGTPYQANILGVHSKPETITLPNGQQMAYDSSQPLETVVEKENLIPTLFLRSQMGRHLVKILSRRSVKQYAGLFLEKYPIDVEIKEDDEEGRTFSKAIAGLLPDGYQVYREMQDDTYKTWVSTHPQIQAAHQAALLEVRDDFVKWFHQLYEQPAAGQTAWVPEHLEYNFALESRIAGDKKRRLIAGQYASGHLDWKDFDQEITAGDAAVAGMAAPEEVVQTFIPTPLKFGGMPHPRLWQMEDRTTDFGKIDASPTSLLNLLLAEYGLTYSNDWFILPYELDSNTICEIKGIVVTDVFGQNSLVAPAVQDPEMNWQQFAFFHQTEHNNATVNESIFYLAPAVGKLMEGEDLEKVNFIRDEMSNMVWAIEHTVPSQAGGGYMLKRTIPTLQAFEPAEGEAKIRYVLGNTVPDNWIPFIPVQKQVPAGQAPGEIRLQRARMPQGTRALSRVLTECQPTYFIEEEEVPRAGVIIRQSFQRTRWLNGKTFLWLGRRKQAGRGEGLANLLFDQILPIQQNTR